MGTPVLRIEGYGGVASLLIQPRDSILHILEADVGVHIGCCRRRGVAELLLDLSEVPGLPQ